MTLSSASCSQSEPTISIEQIEGHYKSATCPDLIISGNQLVTNDGNTSFELIRIKQNDILATTSTPRVDLDGGCQIVMDSEPSYISVDTVEGHFAFDVYALDRTKVVRFSHVE